MKIYLAGALFSEAERKFNIDVAEYLESKGHEVFLPQIECDTNDSKEIFKICKNGVLDCDVVVAILEGADVDSGTSWEMGYAYGIGKPVIGLRTDFRENGDSGGLNAMLLESTETVCGGISYLWELSNYIDVVLEIEKAHSS